MKLSQMQLLYRELKPEFVSGCLKSVFRDKESILSAALKAFHCVFPLWFTKNVSLLACSVRAALLTVM